MPLNQEEQKLLEEHGWVMVCESPLEFERDAQFAGGIHTLYSEEEQREELQIIIDAKNREYHLTLTKKVDWDTYFIAQCFLVSMRSIDPSTKHGSVIVDKYNRILATGYNGPIRGINDSLVPLTRPEKYPFIPHAEENALLSLGVPILEDGKIYVTGKPCHKCLRMILQKGIRHIVYGPLGSKCVDEEDQKASNNMIKWTGAKIVEYTNIERLKEFLNEYMNRFTNF
jgi:dCMP deaminase